MSKILKSSLEIFVCTIIVYMLLNVEFLLNNEFNLITINTVLVGFLFTIYTILMSFTGEEVIDIYEQKNEMSKIYNNITLGIIYGVLSVLITIIGLGIFKVKEDITISNYHKLWLSLDLSFFILVMKSTLFSIIDINSIVGAIRDNKHNSYKRDKANADMEKRFRNKKK